MVPPQRLKKCSTCATMRCLLPSPMVQRARRGGGSSTSPVSSFSSVIRGLEALLYLWTVLPLDKYLLTTTSHSTSFKLNACDSIPDRRLAVSRKVLSSLFHLVVMVRWSLAQPNQHTCLSLGVSTSENKITLAKKRGAPPKRCPINDKI
ncbi:MAG: hypothetical protein [Circular genetic element sp.]|nr:MAG: hypothetical protein [Circular genetic element sp.]